MTKCHAIPLCPTHDMNHPFVQCVHTVYTLCPLVTLVAVLVITSAAMVLSACVQVTLILLNNVLKAII